LAAPDARALSPGISIGRWGKAGSHGLFIEEFVGFTRQSELVDADGREVVCIRHLISESYLVRPLLSREQAQLKILTVELNPQGSAPRKNELNGWSIIFQAHWTGDYDEEHHPTKH
jgi:hypothetical protein